MKVVINKCYGGFGLSKEATILLCQKKDIDFKHMYDDPEEDIEIFNKEGTKSYIYYYDSSDDDDDDDYGWFYINRHDKDLVAVVEELGEKAYGSFSELSIVDIPIKEYTVEEYDGIEWISEPHRTWH